MAADPLADDGLFPMDAPPPVSLADRFGVPPFSVLDRRSGRWQDRKRAWLGLGIKSELGRGLKGDGDDPDAVESGLLYTGSITRDPGYYDKKAAAEKLAGRPLTPAEFEADYYVVPEGGLAAGTSIFDPVICELVYRWFSAQDWRVLDPFAGGSVRGIVAGILHRKYLGFDLRADQVSANQLQGHTLTEDGYHPAWLAGDSRTAIPALPAGLTCDLVFTCPPYADLEVYSDDPADLSNMPYAGFLSAQTDIIRAAADRLADDRFFCWVTSDVRDMKTGSGPYRGLVADTIGQGQVAGLELYNDFIIVDPVGSGALRATKQFTAKRKAIRMHQHLLVFTKGDAAAATRAMEEAGAAGVAEDAERALLAG
jgi:hypothetical protein